MKSKTKFILEKSDIDKIAEKAGIGGISSFSPLGKGMFNAVYEMKGDKTYVLKIAPKTDIPVMTYENDMLKTELYWYKVIKENTDISVPEIYCCDFSLSAVPAAWFIMEKINGVHRNKLNMQNDEKLQKSAEIIAKMHDVKNDKYGYVQNGLHGDWYSALYSMIENMLDDLKRVKKRSKRGEKLLHFCEKYADILRKAPCTMVNYDLWDSNLICNENGKFTLIDPERSMWGDPAFDFLCLEGFVDPIKKKTKSLEIHNKISSVKLLPGRELEIRYAFAQGLMALIQETEKYYRFRPFGEGWTYDVASSKIMYKLAFKVLENEK